jgi:phosphonate utilization transcriptional regulator
LQIVDNLTTPRLSRIFIISHDDYRNMELPSALEVLRNQSLPALVQEEIERMILDGRLLPGEPLREVAISALLGISRGPVREAFRGLEEKGLLRIVKNCGVYVRTLDIEEADQIYEVRIVLEAMIGDKAARRITPEESDALRRILEEMEQAVASSNINHYTALNVAFHDALAASSGNRKLHETYNRLVAELSLFRRQTYLHDEDSLATSLREHTAICNAVTGQQPQLAAELLQRHAADSRQRLHLVLGNLTQDLTPGA